MRLVIHDLEKNLYKPQLDDLIIDQQLMINPCMGCFGCWTKTPGKCVIPDDIQDMGRVLGESKELLIISRCCYGGFSPFVKKVLDRSIGYVLPDFRIVDGEMHHQPRYPAVLPITVYFYGDDISHEEKRIARRLVSANALNLNARIKTVRFFVTSTILNGDWQ